MKILRDIDFNKYNTFFLEYYNGSDGYSAREHLIRPSILTYNDIVDASKTRAIVLESAVLSFDSKETISQIVLKCSFFGISLDFIDVYVYHKDKLSWDDYKFFKLIDMHTDSIDDIVDIVDAPQFYVALNKSKHDILKFLIVDRFCQSPAVKFLNGDYDAKAVIAGFKAQHAAYELCKKLNDQK